MVNEPSLSYSAGMNNLLKSPTILTRSRGLNLILTASEAHTSITELIAAFILQAPLFVVAGSGWLPTSELTDLLCKTTSDVMSVLNRLYTARASTCYQLFDELGSRRSNGEPILVLDFLHTFNDPDIALPVRLFTLKQCCRELSRLAFYRPVSVITQDIHSENLSDDFLSVLTSVADRTFSLEAQFEPVNQTALF
jgi:hypothetical protein